VCWREDLQLNATTGEDREADAASGRTATLRCVWRAFNGWRRRRWHVRVLVLLLIFGPTMYERLAHRMLLVRLVRIACDAILLAGTPPAEYHLRRYYRAQEAWRLQQVLTLALDADGDGALAGEEAAETRRLGLGPEDLSEPSRGENLCALIAAAREAGLVPAGYTEREVLWRTYYAARGRAEALARPGREAVERCLAASYAWPDYTDPATWELGGRLFVGGVRGTLEAVAGGTFGLLAGFLFALALTMAVRAHRPVVGAVCGALVGLVLLATALRWERHLAGPAWPLYAFGVLCFWTAVGLGAGRLGARLRDRPVAALASGCLFGLTLAGGTVGRVLAETRALRALGIALVPHYLSRSRFMHWGPVCAGAAIALCCGVALVVLFRRRRAASRRVVCPDGGAHGGGEA
jgi:hypothetical protein